MACRIVTTATIAPASASAVGMAKFYHRVVEHDHEQPERHSREGPPLSLLFCEEFVSHQRALSVVGSSSRNRSSVTTMRAAW